VEAFSKIPDSDKQLMVELQSLLKTINSEISKWENSLLENTKQHYEIHLML